MMSLLLTECCSLQFSFCSLLGIMIFVIMGSSITIMVFCILIYKILCKMKRLVRIISEIEE